MKNRRICTLLLTIVLALAMLLPGNAPALTEDKVETAPPIVLAEEQTESNSTENTEESVPYLPFADSLPDRSEPLSEEEQYLLPRLTNSELERIRQLTADLKEGKAGEWMDYEAAEKKENVLVGVYPLNPAEFDGETYYVILPGAGMNDNMLLSLIAAFEKLGIPFEPDALNERNCMRGFSTDANRGLSYEEYERATTIRYQIHRGMITPERIPADTYCRYVQLASVYDSSYRAEPTRFFFFPYRSMTDNELAAVALASEGAWETDPDVVEKKALEHVRELLNVPMALTVGNEQMFRGADGTMNYMHVFSVTYADERTGKAVYPNGEISQIQVNQIRDPESDEISLYYIALYYYMDEAPGRESGPAYTEEEWTAKAKEWVGKNLRIPEDRQPLTWQLSESPEDSYVTLDGQRDSLDIVLVLNRWDAGGNAAFIWNLHK